jgi:membrane fusion protein (multidrug efflux system)
MAVSVSIGFASRAFAARSGFALKLVAALVAALVLAGCDRAGGKEAGKGAHAGGPPPAEVAVEKVQPGKLPAVFEYVGQTAGSRDIEVRARVTGILEKRNYTEGAVVRKGQSMYTLDTAPFQAALERADADVAAADARVAQAGRTLARQGPLWEARAVSRREFDDATSADQIAKADLKGAKARRSEALLNLQYTKVEAPIMGLAGRSQVSEGTLVSGPQVLLTTVTQTDPIKLRFGIADTDQMRWRSEMASGQLQLPDRQAFDVELKLADGSTYARRGKLIFSDTRVSNTSGTVEAEAEVPNPDGQLKPGQFVRVYLHGASRPNAVKVPMRAVLEGPQGKFVYLMADGKALPRPVEAGDQVADGWIITKGLKAGDEVIIDGMARIFFPGAPVKLAQAAPPAGAASAPAGGAAAPAAGAAPAPASASSAPAKK